MEHLVDRHLHRSMFTGPNGAQHERAVVIAMAVVTEHDQIVLSLEAEAFVRAVMHFEAIAVAAQVTGVAGLLERQPPHALPVRRFEVFGVRQPAERSDRVLERAIDIDSRHEEIAHD